jgi:hypothetical protein
MGWRPHSAPRSRRLRPEIHRRFTGGRDDDDFVGRQIRRVLNGAGGEDRRRIDAKFTGDTLQGITVLHDVARLGRHLLGIGDDDPERQEEERRESGGGEPALPAAIPREEGSPERARRSPSRLGAACGWRRVDCHRREVWGRTAAEASASGSGQQRAPRRATVGDAQAIGADFSAEESGIDTALEHAVGVDTGQTVSMGIEGVRRADGRGGCRERQSRLDLATRPLFPGACHCSAPAVCLTNDMRGKFDGVYVQSHPIIASR